MKLLKRIIPFLLKILKAIAGDYPVGLVVIGMIDSIVAGVKEQDTISDKSVKDILIAVAKSKGNSIDQVKIVKALKALGLDSITKEEMEGIPEAIKKTTVKKRSSTK